MIKKIIFDMDSTLIDIERIKESGWTVASHILGIDYFDIIIDGDRIENGKLSPDIYRSDEINSCFI